MMAAIPEVHRLRWLSWRQSSRLARRNVAYVKVYTDVYLRPQRASEAGTDGQDADIIEWMGRHFMIVQCDAYQSGVISHYRAYAKEVLADDT